MAENDTPEPMADRSFSRFLSGLEEGQAESDLTDAYRDLVQTCMDSVNMGGKGKGSITIKIDFAYDGSAFDHMVDFKVVKPKFKRARSVRWPTREGFLSRRNTKQHELPLRDVTPAQQAVRSV